MTTPAPIQLSDLSRYRRELMGIAIIMVVCFHVCGSHNETLPMRLARCGNVGVDMFFFISGMGLWFAWSKLYAAKDENMSVILHSLPHFYRRRLSRVYPTWIAVACAYYIPLYNSGSTDLWQTIKNITVNSGFWDHCELRFWFIPAIMALYIVAPAYIVLIRRHTAWQWLPVVAVVMCVLLHYHPAMHTAIGHLEIFTSRIPIFMLGIVSGRHVMARRTMEPSARWLLLTIFAVSLITCLNFENGLRGHFPLFLERMVYIPLSISTMLLLCRLLAHLPAAIRRAFAFAGGISLEIYLIHCTFVLFPLKGYVTGYLPMLAAVLAISIPAAWVLQKAIGLFMNFVGKITYRK